MKLQSIEIKAFVPATDFAVSQRFYAALGFELPWVSDDLAFVRHGHTSFLLQRFDNPAFVRQFQMHMVVHHVDDWHTMACGVAAQFGVAIGTPEDRPWAMRDFTLFDPSGVLWRIAQNIPTADTQV